MSQSRRTSLRDRIALRSEAIFMSYLVPKQSVGSFYRLLFKGPLVMRKLGLGRLVPRNILILTTRGRRTGLARQTPMEFSAGPAEGVMLVMAGWRGNTDW